MQKDLPIIGLLSLGGVAMGLLTSLVGLPIYIEPAAWLALFMTWGMVLAGRQLQKPFFAGLLTSALAGLWTGALQLALGEAYAANNPWYAEQIAEAGGVGITFVGQGVVAGAVFGLAIGGYVWHAQRKRRKRR